MPVPAGQIDQLLTQAAQVAVDGNRIILNFQDLASALEAWKPWRSVAKRGEFMQKIHDTLTAMGLAIEIRVAGHMLGGFGPGVQRGLLQRILTPVR